jgi:hypothetical protein
LRADDLPAEVVRDPDGQIARALGATGTPMAVRIDGAGNVVSTVAAGGPATLALLEVAARSARAGGAAGASEARAAREAGAAGAPEAGTPEAITPEAGTPEAGTPEAASLSPAAGDGSARRASEPVEAAPSGPKLHVIEVVR